MFASRPATISERPRTRAVGARPRTAVSVAGGPDSSLVVCALTESRGFGAQVGLAFVDTCTSECTLCEFSDSQAALEQNQVSNLPFVIQEHFPHTKITIVPRKHFNHKVGAEYISRLSFRSEAEAVQIAISGKLYAISAVAAAIKQVELQYNIRFQSNALRVKYQSHEGAMIIDISTVRNLELIQNLRNPKSGDCLYGLLDHTATPMGARLLRSSILQPLKDKIMLGDRLDAVQEMVSSQEMLQGTKKGGLYNKISYLANNS
ncbi:hypothetical protein ABW21_db0204996 [Orbilia brochopaga]|nr:hypothetical protein ABW21_db0204996 [Drechslerella brochopaga]